MTIRNDATRLRIATRDKRHARSVVSRQGQVLLDADFDQQSGALLGRIETEAADVFDSAGKLVYPAGTTGFQISASGAAANFDIGAGHGYLDGWLLENPATAKLGTQPHPRIPTDTVTPPAIVALKALVRHVDPVEDPALADAALGDAKASGRALNDWQVFPLDVGGAGVECATAANSALWTALIAPSAGKMSVIKQAAAPSTDPCSLTPGGGYTRLENLLYRLEIHGGAAKAGFPTVDGPRFALANLVVKFSRRNASLMARITQINGSEITVEPASLDARAWFAPGAFAEIVSVHDDVDPRAALAHERLFRIALATDEKVVLDATAGAIGLTNAVADGSWSLRLWDAFPDGSGTQTISVAGGNSQIIDLGDGLSIRFHNGAAATFRRGDFWTFAARADGSVAWPETVPGTPDQMVPHGPETRYAILAAVTGTSASPVFENCSIPSFSLTDKFLFYRGGDGQGVFAGAAAPAFVPLPQKLRVAVMRGETPVKGARIVWSPPAGAADSQIDGQPCTVAIPPITITDADGLCEVEWAIDKSKPLDTHRVQAALVLGATTTLADPIVFNATFETARHTAYEPGKCKHLSGVDNVQDALDTLCKEIDGHPPVLTLTEIKLTSATGAVIDLIDKNLILNGLEVPYDAFLEEIAFGFDKKLDINIESFDPIAEIELDLPYPTTDPDRIYWMKASHQDIRGAFGFQRMRLDGKIRVAGKRKDFDPGLVWTPSPQARNFLVTAPFHLYGRRVEDDRLKDWISEPSDLPILCRLRLRGPMIWNGAKEERAYLNAEHLGIVDTKTHRELSHRARDPQTAADLDIFIYLKVPKVDPNFKP